MCIPSQIIEAPNLECQWRNETREIICSNERAPIYCKKLSYTIFHLCRSYRPNSITVFPIESFRYRFSWKRRMKLQFRCSAWREIIFSDAKVFKLGLAQQSSRRRRAFRSVREAITAPDAAKLVCPLRRWTSGWPFATAVFLDALAYRPQLSNIIEWYN